MLSKNNLKPEETHLNIQRDPEVALITEEGQEDIVEIKRKKRSDTGLSVFNSVQIKIVRKTAFAVILMGHATFHLLPINNIGSQLLKQVL